MKQFNSLRNLLLLVCLGMFSAANAQYTVHPLSFGYIGSDSSNFYKDYVGTRVEVTSPSIIAGVKNVTEESNVAADGWTDMTLVDTPFVNVPIIMPPASDSFAASPFEPGSMTGRICVIWRGGTIEFGQKALYAQNAGAVAVIIINNVPDQGPLGMLAGTLGSTVHIPTFMIGYNDGAAIAGVYDGGTGVNMTITPWGLNLANDLGFVPKGIAQWHDYAVPSNQIMNSSATNNWPYQGFDGAFIGNFGTNNATNVVLSSSVTFTPTGGSASSIYSGSQALTSFPELDSIWAIYEGTGYDVSSHITGTGTVTVNYSLTSDSVDANPGDNTSSYSYYITDSLYSKGVYDMVNNHPSASIFESPGFSSSGPNYYLWGPMYYVAHGGTTADSIKWTMIAENTTSGADTGLVSNYYSAEVGVFLFKWQDGLISADSIVQNGELTLVGAGFINFIGDENAADTSGGYFGVSVGDSNGNAAVVTLDSNSWYFVAPELIEETGITLYMGCDGVNNPYPRTFGRYYVDDLLEYETTLWPGGDQNGGNLLSSYPDNPLEPVVFGGSYSYITSLDSVIFSSQKEGLTPAVALQANNHPAPNAVKQVNATVGNMSLFPNPATDYVNVNLTLNSMAKNVTYTVLDASARTVSKVSHSNVQSEIYTYNTDKLATGTYFMVVAADGKSMFRKFTVAR